jgi:hypothetical protein
MWIIGIWESRRGSDIDQGIFVAPLVSAVSVRQQVAVGIEAQRLDRRVGELVEIETIVGT